MDADQDLLDRFAIAAMRLVGWSGHSGEYDAISSDRCWQVAIAMKQARDRICTTAKAAPEHVPPFPKIEMEET